VRPAADAGAGGVTGEAAGQADAPRPPRPLDGDLRVSRAGWKTDFSRHTIALSEIASGGPGKDGIPPLDRPAFVSTGQAGRWLRPAEPVIALEINGAARAYPLQMLIWHEIVNDTLAGVPVTVTFCPLCNTAIVFDRRLDSVTYDFGTTGNLRHSDLVMWDRQTESWWQQVTGEAIVGTLAGKRLTMLPASIVAWKDFAATWPAGEVLSQDTGFRRSYGSNPYVGYDDVTKPPFLFRGPTDGRLPPMERVLTVEVADGGGPAYVAYPFSALTKQRVANDTVAGQPLVAFWAPGTASALDAGQIASSRDVGAAAAFDPRPPATSGAAPAAGVTGESRLTFRVDPANPERFVDAQTGSTWDVTGSALSGPLQGTRLTPLVHGNHFWFAWAAFRPETRIWSH
jgi:hypothetical protein